MYFFFPLLKQIHMNVIRTYFHSTARRTYCLELQTNQQENISIDITELI